MEDHSVKKHQPELHLRDCSVAVGLREVTLLFPTPSGVAHLQIIWTDQDTKGRRSVHLHHSANGSLTCTDHAWLLPLVGFALELSQRMEEEARQLATSKVTS